MTKRNTSDEEPTRYVKNQRLAPRMSSAIDKGGLETVDGDAFAYEMLVDAVNVHASDIHVTPLNEAYRLQFRIDGALLTVAEIPYGLGERIIRHLKVTSGLKSGPVLMPRVARGTMTIERKSLDLRFTYVPTLVGEKMAARLLDPQQLDRRITDLGLSEADHDVIGNWLRSISGMFLVTGSSGSGKTTTLYALLHELKSRDRSIVTIEDPVENQIDGISQMQVNESNGLNFEEGIQAMLRLDVDIMLLGEIRDEASAHAALEASSTGRVLMSSLHTRNAVGSVMSLRNWGVMNHEIAASLEVVVDQRLMRRLCPACRKEESPTPEEVGWLRSIGFQSPETTWHTAGCNECHGLGYSARTGVFEVWRIQEEDRQQILVGAGDRELRKQLNERNHRSLFVDGLSRVQEGATTLRELQTMSGVHVPEPGDDLTTIEAYLERHSS